MREPPSATSFSTFLCKPKKKLKKEKKKKEYKNIKKWIENLKRRSM